MHDSSAIAHTTLFKKCHNMVICEQQRCMWANGGGNLMLRSSTREQRRTITLCCNLWDTL